MKALFLLKEQKMKLHPHITRLVFLAIVLLSLGVSCKDKKTYCEENPSECSNIQGVKDYFCFKQGSWWVYEEQTSLERDSVYVTEYYNNTSNYDFDVRMYSTHQDYFYHFFPSYSGGSNACNPDGEIGTSCIRVRRSKYKLGDFLGETYCFMFLYKKGMYTYNYAANEQQQGNKILIEDVYSDFNVGSFQFEKTVKISEQFTLVENQQPTTHYFSKGIGLIRKELIDSNQVWNLVSYHIEP